MRRLVLIGLTVLGAAGVLSCTADGGVEVPSGPFDASTGAELFAQACATCHGADLRGTEHGPPFLDAIYEPGHHPDIAFLAAAMNGARAHHWNFGDMPRIEGITEEQVRSIVEYVREEQRAAGFE